MLFRSILSASLVPVALGTTAKPATTAEAKAAVSLEIMYLQDVSSSFAGISALIPEAEKAFRTLNETYRYSRFGLGTFSDRPVEPFGGDSTYCYKIQYPLTADWDLFDKPLKNLKFQSGGDEPECQLTALAESGRIQLNRWTDIGNEYKSGEEIIRLALMVTDSSYHVDGDYIEKGFDDAGKLITIPRPDYVFEDTIPRVISVAALEAISQDLDNVDYPQVSVVRDILEERNITPLFIVTENVLSVYEVLVKELGRGHIAVVADDMKDLSRVITQSISHVITEQIQYECESNGSCPCSAPGGCEAADGDMLIHLDAVPKVIRYSKHEVEDFVNEAEFDKLDIVPYEEVQKAEVDWLKEDVAGVSDEE